MGQWIFNNFLAGQPVSAVPASWYQTVANVLETMEGINCHWERNPNGLNWKIIVDTEGVKSALQPTGWGYNKFFDLINVATDTFSLQDNMAKENAAWLVGVKKTIADGAGMTFDTDHWDSAAISANNYVYLSMERASATVSIIMGTSLLDGDDDTENIPLWYVPWSGSKIDGANIVDMRNAHRLPAMA